MDVYRMSFQGRTVPVHPRRNETAAEIDTNGDHYLSHAEILQHEGIRRNARAVDRKGVVHENQVWLQKRPNPDARGYHSYQQVGQALHALARQHPDRCKCVSLGKTEQGRDIWALRVGTPGKPGLIITGCHHAREWMSVEVPLDSARRLVEAAAQGDPEAVRRTAESEVWFVPLVNPDGYEYSRQHDNMWRKNRHPVEAEVNGEKVRSVGVDPDRNYSPLYRQGKRAEQLEQGIDDPREEIYRGPSACSEKENRAMVRLAFGHANVHAVLDYHGYGEGLYYPWGHTRRPCKEHKLYRELTHAMNRAAGGKMVEAQVGTLYPFPGGSEAAWHPNGILELTAEIGGCFQPQPALIAPTCKRMHAANMALLDQVIERSQAGTLPLRRAHPQVG